MENWRVFDLTVSFSSHFQRKYNVTQGSERAIRPLVKLAKSSSALGDVLMLFQELHVVPDGVEDELETQRQSRKQWKEVFVHVTLAHRNQLWITLNRPVVIRAVLCEVINAGLVFGTGTKSIDNVSTFILPFKPRREVCTSPSPADQAHSHTTMECPDVEFGRVLVTAAALASMLRAAGHNTEMLGPHSDIELTQLRATAPSFGSLLHSFTSTASYDLSSSSSSSSSSSFSEGFLTCLSQSHYRVGDATDVGNLSTAGHGTIDSCCHSDCISKSVMVDAGIFLAEHDLIGRNGFSSNIRTISVSDSNGSLTVLGEDALQLYHLLMNNCLVVVATQQHEHQIQQCLALALMATAHVNSSSAKDEKQEMKKVLSRLKLVLTSPVKCVRVSDHEPPADVGLVSVEELMHSRLGLMRTATQFKFGETVPGPVLDDMVKTLANTVIKFEHLSIDPAAQLKFDLPTSEDSDVRFDGVFVLYNYARLSTILQKYHLEVQTGQYPPLPEVATVDTSLLREEEEWGLVLRYILHFPIILQEAAEIKTSCVGLRGQSGLKKLCQFLTSLCHYFSGYYSRVKILLAPEPHLLPLVHARVHLVMAIKQVLLNGLHILGICPLDQL